ncbi:MAG TPA: ATP-binding cassette domain-containing protein [Chthoniobacteraceae bacterium]|nr:ATP-binding cassette domain-containing protein [Chthoniobacteraceae bacterium]
MTTTADTATPPILSLHDLCLVRDRHPILDRVSWTITPGQHWAILGANGSGKTSLLSALTGYQTPTSGVIEVLGQRYGASNWPELRKRIGIVSSAIRQQMADGEPALVTVVSGKYAMIDYWGTLRVKDRQEAKEILEWMGCLHLARRPWVVLSQGERQRILIGRALMAKPEILIIDEPCAGLDPVAREDFLAFMHQLIARKDAPTLLLVTHHIEEIVEGISHVLALRDGKVVASGQRDKVLRGPVLSEVFGQPVKVQSYQGRRYLRVEPSGGRQFGAQSGG